MKVEDLDITTTQCLAFRVKPNDWKHLQYVKADEEYFVVHEHLAYVTGSRLSDLVSKLQSEDQWVGEPMLQYYYEDLYVRGFVRASAQEVTWIETHIAKAKTDAVKKRTRAATAKAKKEETERKLYLQLKEKYDK